MKIPIVNISEIAERNGIPSDNVRSIISCIKASMRQVRIKFKIRENGLKRYYCVTRRGVGSLKTPYGLFWQNDFSVTDRWERYSVLVRAHKLSPRFMPLFRDSNKIVVRIDSGCETGQKFGDMTCDCREQLMQTMDEISRSGEGIIVNIPDQDGRGMGLPFKLATLSLQEQLHLNTVEAASILTEGGKIDRRTYGGVIAILRFLNVSRKATLCLATNNPHKLEVFKENGYQNVEMQPLRIPPNQHTRRHFEAKQLYLGHHNLVTEGRVYI